jgi:chemotaxis protein histidine kinase CheA
MATKTQDTEALFPPLPEDLAALDDEALATLLKEFNAAAELIDAEDAEFTKGLEADEIVSQYTAGLESMEAIAAEQQERSKAVETYQATKNELAERRKALLGETSDEDAEDADGDEDAEATATDAKAQAKAEEKVDEEIDELAAETDKPESSETSESAEGKAELTAAGTVRMRRTAPPTPADRGRQSKGAILVASSAVDGYRAGTALDPMTYADAVAKTAQRAGRVSKHEHGREERVLIASASFEFPENRVLHAKDWEANSEKIRDVVPESVPGMPGMPLNHATLVASGGLCAPLEPIYTMPNFASQARPVRDALPSFRAARGGVNVPTATYIGDITTAITVITEEEDAQGGTFATKSCQALDCPPYTETAVTVIAHCREYGNLVSMTWPEKIAHENALTMAAHARTAESYLLDRIKALSLNVTNGAETLGAMIYLVDAIVKARFGIIGRLRMNENARFRALLPFWVPEMLALDTVQTSDGTRFTSRAQLVTYLRDRGIEPAFYLDSPSTGTTQLPDAAQTAAAIDSLPDNVQWALYPEGAFLHLDAGSLELGLVRDSTLNSTNDHQLFGESFENVARIAPQQATYWITSDLCANGMLAPAGTARTCD